MEQRYVLITAARNEEDYIEETIESVLLQTILPMRWAIVSDGSTDQTDEIIQEYANRHHFIKYVRREDEKFEGNFASKVYAIKMGYERLKELDYDFLGNLDADITLEPNYYKEISKKFASNPKLGIAGGYVYENYRGYFESRPFNTTRSVAGAIQCFKRGCYEAIGGHTPVSAGGEDWFAEVMARMKGWDVESFEELKVFHHKRSENVRGVVKENFRQGMVDYSLGSHPVFEIAKCLGRLKGKPLAIGALIRFMGYLWSSCFRKKRPISDELVRYLRNEQIHRLRFSLATKFHKQL